MKISGSELGEAIGVTKATISTVENGRYWPSGELLHYLAERYRVREAYILRGEGEIFEPDDVTPISGQPPKARIVRSIEDLQDELQRIKEELQNYNPANHEENGD